MTTQEQLLRNIMSKVSHLDIIAGANGTIKLSEAGTYTGQFKAIAFSAAAVVTSLDDTDANDIDDYFTDTTYDAASGDIIIAKNMQNGNKFSEVVLASGSAVIIL
jgi:hypothetical protein